MPARAADVNERTAIKYGVFINTIVDVVIVAFAIFVVIKQMNPMKKAPPAADPTTKGRCDGAYVR